jgi:hypothetical protein
VRAVAIDPLYPWPSTPLPNTAAAQPGVTCSGVSEPSNVAYAGGAPDLPDGDGGSNQILDLALGAGGACLGLMAIGSVWAVIKRKRRAKRLRGRPVAIGGGQYKMVPMEDVEGLGMGGGMAGGNTSLHRGGGTLQGGGGGTLQENGGSMMDPGASVNSVTSAIDQLAGGDWQLAQLLAMDSKGLLGNVSNPLTLTITLTLTLTLTLSRKREQPSPCPKGLPGSTRVCVLSSNHPGLRVTSAAAVHAPFAPLPLALGPFCFCVSTHCATASPTTLAHAL